MSDQKIYRFRYFWKSNSFVLMGTILLMLLLTSCVPQSGAAQPQTLSHANEIGGYIELVDVLRTQSVTVEPSGTIDQPFFGVQGQVMKVNGIEVQVFEFADELTREASAAQISPDGSSIGTTMVTWMDQPNFWARGRVIVLYVGQDAATLELLTTVLGAPIARGGIQEGESSLVNTRWILVSFDWPGAEAQVIGSPVLEGSTITLDFIAGGLAGGSGGCNSYTTQYKVQERSISFAQVISTLIACEEGIDQQEQRYYQALESAQEYEHAEDQLVVWYDDGQGVLYFVRESESTGTPAPTPTPYVTPQPTSTPTQPANQPTPSPERINFQAGATFATETGNLPDSGSDFYVLRALGGQTMTVELSFTQGQAILAIWGKDGTVLLSDHAEATRFQGVLPSTQDYFILLKGRPDGETNYGMEVVIPPLPSN
jgi:heat shock protein HslJ